MSINNKIFNNNNMEEIKDSYLGMEVQLEEIAIDLQNFLRITNLLSDIDKSTRKSMRFRVVWKGKNNE